MKRHEALNILGLNENFSEDELKKSFRKLAAANHPDVNKEVGAEDKFKQINSAYQILSGKEHAEEDRNTWGGHPAGVNHINVEDFFNINVQDFFRQSSQVKQRPRIEQTIVETQISFEDAVLGCKQNISYTIKNYCSKCETSGLDTSAGQKCTVCGGSGRIRQTIGGGAFIRVNEFQCNNCAGRGVLGSKCKHCNGKGYNEETKTLLVTIPAIGANITKISLPQVGNTYNNMKTDAILIVKPNNVGSGAYEGYIIDEHRNVRSLVEVPLDKILFGGTDVVNTVGGEIREFTILPMAHEGDEIQISNAGVRATSYNKFTGNHIVTLSIKYPNNNKLTEEVREYITKLYGE